MSYENCNSAVIVAGSTVESNLGKTILYRIICKVGYPSYYKLISTTNRDDDV